MGYRHSRSDILDAAVAVALESGTSALTFSRVGEHLGISDRTVVYYFPTKPELVTAVAEVLGAQLFAVLEEAFGDEPRTELDLVRRAWPALTTPEADRIFRLFFEILGQAAAGEAPYDELARTVFDGWVGWMMPRVEGRTSAVRRRRALGVMATVDGLLLLRQVLGPEAAEDAVAALVRR